jgi:uncharacterized protein YbjT (DUF2867 family)
LPLAPARGTLDAAPIAQPPHAERIMILVLGATGNAGREVARQFVAAGHRPRLLVRAPAKATALADRAEIVRGDLDDPASLAAAMAGVDHLFLVSAGSELVRLERHAVDAARAAGVRHVVKLSVITADRPAITFARWHGESERHLVASGLGWTMLRPGNFATNTLQWAGEIAGTGQFHLPTGDGRWASIDPADIGAVAVRALTEPGHEGQAYALTGPEDLSAADHARALGEALGRPVRHVDVPLEAARAAMASQMPPDYLDAVMDLLAAQRAGHLAGVTDAVPRLLGRPATPYADWARANADAFRAAAPG